MIQNRKELKECLAADQARTETADCMRRLRGFFCHEPYYQYWRYIRAMRFEEYHTNRKNLYHRLMHYLWRRRRNRLGEKTGIFAEPGIFAEGLMIWHSGIVVNSRARVGKNCTLHGQNCIGNDGISEKAPILGDQVTLGTGASIIGEVRIADGITIGAGAVVLHSFDEPGIKLGGIPAHKIGENKAKHTEIVKERNRSKGVDRE